MGLPPLPDRQVHSEDLFLGPVRVCPVLYNEVSAAFGRALSLGEMARRSPLRPSGTLWRKTRASAGLMIAVLQRAKATEKPLKPRLAVAQWHP
jgi:hypothetical protein